MSADEKGAPAPKSPATVAVVIDDTPHEQRCGRGPLCPCHWMDEWKAAAAVDAASDSPKAPKATAELPDGDIPVALTPGEDLTRLSARLREVTLEVWRFGIDAVPPVFEGLPLLPRAQPLVLQVDGPLPASGIGLSAPCTDVSAVGINASSIAAADAKRLAEWVPNVERVSLLTNVAFLTEVLAALPPCLTRLTGCDGGRLSAEQVPASFRL